MSAVARLAAVSIDTADPRPVAEFYRQLLGLEVFFDSDDFVALKGAVILLTFQRVADQRPPDWPEGELPKQLHLEFAVADVEVAEQAALGLGAVKAATQPAPEKWRVLIDPAGHPFCLSSIIPET